MLCSRPPFGVIYSKGAHDALGVVGCFLSNEEKPLQKSLLFRPGEMAVTKRKTNGSH